MKGLILSCSLLASFFAMGAADTAKPKARVPPEWMQQGVIYQIQPRAFTQEGTLKAATAKLQHVADTGATIAYLCPVFVADDDMDQQYWSPRQIKSGFNNPRNPYRMKDYYHVDPEYGTDQDLKDLVKEAHRLGLRVMLDMVYLHCGPKPVFLTEHPEFFIYEPNGAIKNAGWRFPALNYDSKKLREYLIANMLYWVREFDVDGFRCDVADGIPLDFWEEAREQLDRLRPDIGMLAEGRRRENLLKAFDANYGWKVCSETLIPILDGRSKKSGEPFTVRDLQARWQEVKNWVPEGGHAIHFTANHDTVNEEYENRRETRLGHANQAAGLVTCFLLDGIPFLYNGQEICDDHRHSIFGRSAINWANAKTPAGEARLALVKQLCELRKRENALSNGEVRWLKTDQPDSVAAILRSTGKSRDILGIVNLSKNPVKVIVSEEDTGNFIPLLTGGAKPVPGGFELEGYGYQIALRKAADVMSAEFWKIWNPDEQKQIDADIEKYRKADVTVSDLPKDAEVKIEQISHDFLFGAHIFNFNQLGTPERNRRYRELYGTLFNEATVSLYWKKFERVPGYPRFADSGNDLEAWWNSCANPKEQFHWRRPASDAPVAYCKSRGIWIHGHPLTWANERWQYPEWLYEQFCPQEEKENLKALTGDAWKKATPQELGKLAPKFLAEINRLMEQRIREIAARYKDTINSYDVVNESAMFMPGADDASIPVVKTSSVKTMMPGGYTTASFKWADDAFPKSVSLNINDFRNGEIYWKQIQDLQARGCRITRMGSQMHLFNPQQTQDVADGKIVKISDGSELTPQGIRKQFEELSKADLPIILSEITITAPNDNAKGRQVQATVARNLYRIWFSIPKMIGIVWWNVVDDCGAPGEPTTSGLFTRAMQPKPSYYALNELIHNEWKTRLTTRTDANGNVSFRGFRGKYRISYAEGGTFKTREIHVQ
ncbi:MAG: endo-1,4-beta-xylanase [Kiritimatiellae bacterium]|nr:endo-1,4-beta-xylanase [Kiritimatiellia bacterium]